MSMIIKLQTPEEIKSVLDNPDKNRCHTLKQTNEPFRLGVSPKEQCENEATFEVTVDGQGKMLMCDECLIVFRGWATEPWMAAPLKLRSKTIDVSEQKSASKHSKQLTPKRPQVKR